MGIIDKDKNQITLENTFNNSFGILKYCTRLEEAFINMKGSKSKLYSLVWVTDGMLDLLVDEVLIPINASQMAFITPVSHVNILENHGRVNIFQFNREFYCIRENDHEVSCEGFLFFGTNGVPIINLNDKETQSFERLLRVLKEEFEIVDTIQEEMLRVVLKKWLIKSTRIFKKQNNFIGSNKATTELFRRFNILLEKHYSKYHKVKDYARLLNKSPKTIVNQFKLLGQESPSTIIQNRIVLEAKRYLLYSPLSIKEIAFKLGFEDATIFSHFFKNKTGSSPKAFKENSKIN